MILTASKFLRAKSQGVVAPFFAKEYKMIMRCGEEMLFFLSQRFVF